MRVVAPVDSHPSTAGCRAKLGHPMHLRPWKRRECVQVHARSTVNEVGGGADTLGKGPTLGPAANKPRGSTDHVMAALVGEAGHAWRKHIREAEICLDTADLDGARRALQTAVYFAAAFERMKPSTVAAERIVKARGALLDGDATALHRELLSIYGGLDALGAYAPDIACTARGSVRQAFRCTRRGDSIAGARKLKEALQLLSANSSYAPLDDLHEKLRSAQRALSGLQPQPKCARAALTDALGGLTSLMTLTPN